MIERLPLDVFDDEPDRSKASPNSDGAAQAEATPDAPTDIATSVEAHSSAQPELLARCQWCAETFDDRLSNCPACGVVHRIASPVNAETVATTCQWCQATFEAGLSRCPECDAMVVVPGQYVLGQNDPDDTLVSRSLQAQRAQSNQLLVGMMLGGGIDNVVAGLIGLAFTLFDDD